MIEMKKQRAGLYFICILILIAILIWANLIVGSSGMTASQVWSVLTGDRSEPVYTSIVLGIRLPRVVAGFLLGGALALSGYLLQTFFANPIVGPFVLGISSGAKLAVALFMIFFLSRGKDMGLFMMVLSAFIGAMTAITLISSQLMPDRLPMDQLWRLTILESSAKVTTKSVMAEQI